MDLECLPPARKRFCVLHTSDMINPSLYMNAWDLGNLQPHTYVHTYHALAKYCTFRSLIHQMFQYRDTDAAVVQHPVSSAQAKTKYMFVSDLLSV